LCCFLILAWSFDEVAPCRTCDQCATCQSSWLGGDVGSETMFVTLDLSACQHERQPINWFCCRKSSKEDGEDGTCDLTFCPPERYSEADARCDFVGGTYTFEVPVTASTVTVQLHDGRFVGNKDCSVAGDCCGQHYGSCGPGLSSVCEVVVDLTECPLPAPECEDDSQCFSEDCADVTCDNGVCTNTMREPGYVCRDAVDGCDVAEVCDGTHLYCPDDIDYEDDNFNTFSYVYKCGNTLYMCGPTPTFFTPAEDGIGYYLADPSCYLGDATNLVQLTWPRCSEEETPTGLCENGHQIEYYQETYCTETVGTPLNWNCDGSPTTF